MRNILSQVPKNYQGRVSSIIRTIFFQNDQASAREQFRHVVDELKNHFPNRNVIIRLVGAMLMEQNDEWVVGCLNFSLESIAKLTPVKEFTWYRWHYYINMTRQRLK